MIQPLPILPEPSASEAEYQQTIAEIRRHLEAVRDLPGLDTFQKTRALPAAFFEHFNAALAAYDRLIDYVLGYKGEDQQIQCKRGCCNCCVDLVRGMTTPEIANIYHYVRTNWDFEARRQAFTYHAESAELFTNLLLKRVQPGEPPVTGRDDRIAQTHIEYNQQKRPCGFLNQQTGECRIYPVRPLACRYFFSFDPPEMCTPSHEMYLKRSTRTVHLPEEVHALIRAIDHKFGFRPLNYLSGAFCQFAAEVMRGAEIAVANGAAGAPLAE